jgi:hypothetical protein
MNLGFAARPFACGGLPVKRFILTVACSLIACAGAGAAPVGGGSVTYIDLQPYANHKLNDSMHLGEFPNNNLADLPQGKQKLAGVKFKIGESLIQLRGNKLQTKPERVDGIAVNKKVAKLHILHATGYFTEDGTLIGEYLVHFADNSTETIPVVYGKDVRDWWVLPNGKETVSRGKVAWTGTNGDIKARDGKLCLYLTTWKNPKPNTKVVGIDYISKNTQCMPFCIAMTVEGK